MLRTQIKQAIANHPGVSLQGLCNLLSFDKADLKKELKQMSRDGILVNTGRYYKLKPMYQQLNISYAED